MDVEQITKRCPSCNSLKPSSAFPPNTSRSDGLQALCRTCYSAYQRAYYRRRSTDDPEYRQRQKRLRKARRERLMLENRNRLWEYLAVHPCVDCGEADPVVLELDHTDQTDKAFTIGDAIFHRQWTEILIELEKCEVRCANCHRRRTAEQFGFYRYMNNGA